MLVVVCRKRAFSRNLKTGYALDRQCIKEAVCLGRSKSMKKDTSTEVSL